MANDKQKFDLETIRHSTAHLMAQAVQQLYPDTQVTIGPVIEDGFYYDFCRKSPFVPEDLEKIEQRMKEIAAQNLDIVRKELPREDALKMFDEMGEPFKLEVINELESNEAISVY
ncbi:MAG TPA: threonine--tRNA ligase, partial [Nitrospinaceae bacterium]|nr:threonine--tRNA ligase [Nitrospinaceae bacterium]